MEGDVKRARGEEELSGGGGSGSVVGSVGGEPPGGSAAGANAVESGSADTALVGEGGKTSGAAPHPSAAMAAVAATTAIGTGTGAPASTNAGDKDKDIEIPLNAVNRVLKLALPESTTPTREAKLAFAKAAGIFVLYVTACANEFAKEGKRSTLSSTDILTALNELGFGSFVPALEAALEQHKSASADKKHDASDKRKRTISGVVGGSGAAEEGGSETLGETQPGALPSHGAAGVAESPVQGA